MRPIVPWKRSNNGRQLPAEVVEGRASPKARRRRVMTSSGSRRSLVQQSGRDQGRADALDLGAAELHQGWAHHCVRP